jgi:hypothetical protein
MKSDTSATPSASRKRVSNTFVSGDRAALRAAPSEQRRDLEASAALRIDEGGKHRWRVEVRQAEKVDRSSMPTKATV